VVAKQCRGEETVLVRDPIEILGLTQQLRRPYGESAGHSLHSRNAGRFATAFQLADVGGVELGRVGEILDGPVTFKAETANDHAERSAEGAPSGWHPPTLDAYQGDGL
jgi:hypothetical protein